MSTTSAEFDGTRTSCDTVSEPGIGPQTLASLRISLDLGPNSYAYLNLPGLIARLLFWLSR